MSISSCDSDSLGPPPISVLSPASQANVPFALLSNQVHTRERLRTRLGDMKRAQAVEQAKRKEAKGKCRERKEERPIKENVVPVAPAVAENRSVKSEPVDADHLLGPRVKAEPVEEILQPARTREILPRIDFPSAQEEVASDVVSHNIPSNITVYDVYDELRFTRGILSGFPKPFGHMGALPPSFCTYQAGRHGYMFTSHLLFPRPDNDDVVVIACSPRRRRRIGWHLDMISLDRTAPIEVAFPSVQPGGLTYLGSFMPENVWAPFTDAYIGDVQGLLNFWSKVANPQRVNDLRLRYEIPNNGLSYCLLKHVHFNKTYYDSLEHFTTNAAMGTRQSTKRKRDD